MASRASLNKALLIGNLTRDPELRYTPNGNAVCTFGLATNRTWVTDGQRHEETEFHRVVAWNKLAELCSKLLTKGRKVYAEGRIQTRSWQTPDGQQRQSTEIVIDDMRILDSRKGPGFEEGHGTEEDVDITEEVGRPSVSPGAEEVAAAPSEETPASTDEATADKPAKEEEKPEDEDKKAKKQAAGAPEEPAKDDDLDLGDIPF